jgi:uncharacterized protein (DUF362 family)
MSIMNRRNFLKASALGGVAATYMNPLKALAALNKKEPSLASVAITSGDNRADLAFRALQPYAKEIAQAIGNRRVVLKPNNVSISLPLCATHVDTLEGILEFLKSIGKLNNVIIAESAASGPTLDGFSNYGYNRLVNRYPVKLVDLDQEGSEVLYVFDEKDFKPHPIKISSLMLSRDSYIVSVARMKTHDWSIVTLSLKNIVFGSPVKDLNYTSGPRGRRGLNFNKTIAHGSGIRGINYNLFALAPQLHPHLALIDGFEGMEGNGPSRGTPVDHRVCVVSTDWLAADRVAVELMGINFNTIGYLNYCAQAGMGIADLSKIEIIGEDLNRHIKHYKLSDNIEEQLIWMKPVS